MNAYFLLMKNLMFKDFLMKKLHKKIKFSDKSSYQRFLQHDMKFKKNFNNIEYIKH